MNWNEEELVVLVMNMNEWIQGQCLEKDKITLNVKTIEFNEVNEIERFKLEGKECRPVCREVWDLKTKKWIRECWTVCD